MNWSPESRAVRVLRGGDAELLERASLATPLSELVLAAPVASLMPQIEDPIGAAYEAGVQAGRKAAEATAIDEDCHRREESLRDLAKSLASAVDSIADNRRAVLDEVLSEVGELVFSLVRDLVGEELALREEPARSAINRALRFAPPDVDLIVYLHPAAALAAWELESIAPGRRVRVVEDARIEEGGCVLEVGSATVDAQIGPALVRLRAALAQLHNTAGLEEAI